MSMIMMTTLLAQAGPDMPAHTTIGSAESIIAAIGGLLVIVFGAMGYGKAQRKSGLEEGKRLQGDVTISGQPITVRKEDGIPTWADLHGLERRVESLERHMDKLADDQAKNFRSLLEAGHHQEIRIREALSNAIGALGAKFSGDIRAVHEKIEKCQDKNLHKKATQA